MSVDKVKVKAKAAFVGEDGKVVNKGDEVSISKSLAANLKGRAMVESVAEKKQGGKGNKSGD